MAQFTEEEAQRIFARAAERQHAASDSAQGFSLEELKEIGQAAGLSPEHIAAAVSDVRFGSPTPTAPTLVMGVQTDVHRSRVVRGELTDEIWEGIVSRLRRTFKTKGIMADVGRSREWTGTNGEGTLSNLHVTAVPVDGGTRITLETSKTAEAQQMKYMPWMIVVAALFFPIMGALKDKAFEPVILFFTGMMLVLGLVGYFGTRRGYRTWSERRQNEFDALLDQFELMALNDETPETAPTRSSAPSQISDLGQTFDELAEAPLTNSDATRSRTRA